MLDQARYIGAGRPVVASGGAAGVPRAGASLIALAQACARSPPRWTIFRHQPRQIPGLATKGLGAMASDTTGKPEDANAQIARLREQVEALMKDRITPAVADVAGRAESAVYGAADTVREQMENVSGRVREQPLLALLIAAAVGYILGRATR
jgi:ElaB/YqjD/DUF883 family membrane-anchored ribosome-binding protein